MEANMDDKLSQECCGSMFERLTRIDGSTGSSGLERKFHAVFTASSDAIALLDAQGRYRAVYAGDSCRLPGTAPDFVGRSVKDVWPDPIAEQIESMIAKTIATRSMGKLVCPVQHGQEECWLSALVAPFGSIDDPCVLWVARDATDEKRTEAALRTAEARLAEAQRIARIGSWEWELASGRLWWSDQMYELYDVDRTSFHLVIENVFELIMPDDRERVRSEVAASVHTGAPIATEYRVRHKSGDLALLYGQGQVSLDHTGRPWRFSGTVQDVTVQRRTQTRVQRSERLASLGVLAAGIAHEINNPLFAAWVASSAAKAYKQRPLESELLDECLQVIVESIGRCQAVVKNVLLLAGKQSPQKSACDLNAIVLQAFETTRQFCERKLNMSLVQTAKPLQVLANLVELEQMLVNLIRNAIQADSQTIVVGTESSGDEAIVYVRDDGRGIERDAMEQIFDPFFTQGKSIESIGLGLSLAHAIAIDHGGQIEVESTVGQGTLLRVRLPLATKSAMVEA